MVVTGKKYFKRQLRRWSTFDIDIATLIDRFNTRIEQHYAPSQRGTITAWLIAYLDRPTFTFPGKLTKSHLFGDHIIWTRNSSDYNALITSLRTLQQTYPNPDYQSFSWRDTTRELFKNIANNPKLLYFGFLQLASGLRFNPNLHNPSIDLSISSEKVVSIKMMTCLKDYARIFNVDITPEITSYASQVILSNKLDIWDDLFEAIIKKVARQKLPGSDDLQRMNFFEQTDLLQTVLVKNHQIEIPYGFLYTSAYAYANNLYEMALSAIEIACELAANRSDLENYQRIRAFIKFSLDRSYSHDAIIKSIRKDDFKLINFIANFDANEFVTNLYPWGNDNNMIEGLIGNRIQSEADTIQTMLDLLKNQPESPTLYHISKKLSQENIFNSHTSLIHCKVATTGLKKTPAYAETLAIALALDPSNQLPLKALIEDAKTHTPNTALNFYRHYAVLIQRSRYHRLIPLTSETELETEYKKFLDGNFNAIEIETYDNNPFEISYRQLRRVNNTSLIDKFNLLEQNAKQKKLAPPPTPPEQPSWNFADLLFDAAGLITTNLIFISKAFLKDPYDATLRATSPRLKFLSDIITEKVPTWHEATIQFNDVAIIKIAVVTHLPYITLCLTFDPRIDTKTQDLSVEFINETLQDALGNIVTSHKTDNTNEIKFQLDLISKNIKINEEKLGTVLETITEKVAMLIAIAATKFYNFSVRKDDLYKHVNNLINKLIDMKKTNQLNESLDRRVTVNIQSLCMLRNQFSKMVFDNNDAKDAWKSYCYINTIEEEFDSKIIGMQKDYKEILNSYDALTEEFAQLLKNPHYAKSVKTDSTPTVKSASSQTTRTIAITHSQPPADPNASNNNNAAPRPKTTNMPRSVQTQTRNPVKPIPSNNNSSAKTITQAIISSENKPISITQIQNFAPLKECLKQLELFEKPAKHYLKTESKLSDIDYYIIIGIMMTIFQLMRDVATEFTNVNTLIFSERSGKKLHDLLHHNRYLFDEMNIFYNLINMVDSLHMALKNFNQGKLPQANTLANKFSDFITNLIKTRKESKDPTLSNKKQNFNTFINPKRKENDPFFLNQILQRFRDFMFIVPALHSETNSQKAILALQYWMTQLEQDILSLSAACQSDIRAKFNALFDVEKLHAMRNDSRHPDDPQFLSPQTVSALAITIQDNIEAITAIVTEKLDQKPVTNDNNNVIPSSVDQIEKLSDEKYDPLHRPPSPIL